MRFYSRVALPHLARTELAALIALIALIARKALMNHVVHGSHGSTGFPVAHVLMDTSLF